MATANESQPLFSTNSAAWAGSGQTHGGDDVFLDAASCPSSASTRPLAWARSTTRRVVSMFFLNSSCEASIITEPIEAAFDAVVADLFVAVVKMDGENHLGKDLIAVRIIASRNRLSV